MVEVDGIGFLLAVVLSVKFVVVSWGRYQRCLWAADVGWTSMHDVFLPISSLSSTVCRCPPKLLGRYLFSNIAQHIALGLGV